jgi:hypothetical protein
LDKLKQSIDGDALESQNNEILPQKTEYFSKSYSRTANKPTQ